MTKNKSKKRKNKTKTLILLLFLTIVMLATSTYAWFTANKTVKISNIDVNVAAASGIQISTDASVWKTLITTTDISEGYTVGSYTDKNQLPGSMVPVSTPGTATSGYLNFYKGTVEANETTGLYELSAEACDPEAKSTTNGDFIAFDIFLRLDTASDVYLENGSGVIVKEGTTDKGLQYASRMAFVTEGHGATLASQTDLVSPNTASQIIILEPNYDGHNGYGVQQAKTYYTKYTYASGIANLVAGTGNGAITYDAIKAEIASTDPIELSLTNATDKSTYFQTMSNVQKTTTAFSNADEGEENLLLYTAMPAGVTKIRVYMWIEGQDVDCENNASGSDLTFNLSFTLIP